MNNWAVIVVLVVFLLTLNVGVSVSHAQGEIPATYINEGFFDAYHDAPVSFVQDALGNFSGVTTTGKLFTQQKIEFSLSVRISRFSIDEAFFYISDHGIIEAPDDLAALSIYLTRVDWPVV